MTASKTYWGVAAAWLAFVGLGAIIYLALPAGPVRTQSGDVLLCLVPLFANACLLWNAASSYRRPNSFWILLALGCTLWLVGRLVRMYSATVLHFSPSSPVADSILFLHTAPMIGALALQPHARKIGETVRYGFLDLILLAWLWLYIYAFFVLPWGTVWNDPRMYWIRDFQSYAVENLVFFCAIAYLFLRARGNWRRVYGHITCAALTHACGISLVTWSVGRDAARAAGSVGDLLIVISFMWFGTAGIIAHQTAPVPDPLGEGWKRDTQWPVRAARFGVLLTPVMAAWSVIVSDAPESVRQFRVLVTMVAFTVAAAIVFLRQHFVDQERVRLVDELQESVENLKRLQTQLVHSEKLASLGQLAAGAAHEINNPLTAILGYSDMLVEEGPAADRSRSLGEKIREQARRTRELVNNLLSFARQLPVEKQLLDLNTVLAGATQLRTLDLRDKNIRIEMKNATVLPAVRGDPNQLLQVIYHIVSNAVDAMESVGGGVLSIRAMRERTNVIVEFSDTGPGIREPERVFDPFYTTKPVGKGTGLGLSICYGIVQEHGGQISCWNRIEGGCIFRIELPAVLAIFPQMQSTTPVVTTSH